MKIWIAAISLTVAACGNGDRVSSVSPEPAQTQKPTLATPLSQSRAGNSRSSDTIEDDTAPASSDEEKSPLHADMQHEETKAPHQKAPSPTSRDWSRAVAVPLLREKPNCEARRFGEYVRVGCTGTFSNLVEQLAGDPVGVRFGKQATDKQYVDTKYVVFPLRPGDRRIIQFASINGGWKWPWTLNADAVVSAAWLDGEVEPEVVID